MNKNLPVKERGLDFIKSILPKNYITLKMNEGEFDQLEESILKEEKLKLKFFLRNKNFEWRELAFVICCIRERDELAEGFEYNLNKKLILSCLSKNRKMIDHFISKGANSFTKSLMNACRVGDLEVAKLLISKGAKNFQRAFSNACSSGNKELVEWIIKLGKVKNWNDGLNRASSVGNKEIIEMMIEKGAISWDTSLSSACAVGCIEVAQMMIEKGAKDINDALYWACKSGNKEIVEFIISKGATDFDDALGIPFFLLIFISISFQFHSIIFYLPRWSCSIWKSRDL